MLLTLAFHDNVHNEYFWFSIVALTNAALLSFSPKLRTKPACLICRMGIDLVLPLHHRFYQRQMRYQHRNIRNAKQTGRSSSSAAADTAYLYFMELLRNDTGIIIKTSSKTRFKCQVDSLIEIY